jgi:hypothetical protein
VCGKIIVSADPEVMTFPCQHVLFAYMDHFVFRCVSPSCDKITDKALAARDNYGIDAFSYAVEQLDSQAVLCVSVQVGESQEYYAFDFEPMKS